MANRISLASAIRTSAHQVTGEGSKTSSGDEIKRSYATIADVLWEDQPQSMYFYDGCALIGDQNKMRIVSTYANGDPMAIYQKRIGLIGCHPESMPSWYDRPYLQSYWHEFTHHKLLLAFVNNLMKA